ncbi:MAG: DUF4388 domain-containing protein [Deltaproteobacteria bacterium]|nr:DUF4388 domain-containing protein [Deltaproteobacteria bacterium]
MALSGTLSDLGIVDLVQFPSSANKTGELIIAGVEDEARLYYVNGDLKHIICGNLTGESAMTALVGWSEGEFEFRQTVTSEVVSINIAVTELVDKALQEYEAKAARGHSIESPAANVLRKALENTADKLDFVTHVALYSVAGELICAWDRDEADPGLLQLIDEVRTLFDTHPRKGLNKIYLTDTSGTCAATIVNDSFIVLISADDLSSLGMVSLASTKMTAAVMDTFQRR